MEQVQIDKGQLFAVRGMVFNIMRYSTKDGPGLRTTLFLKGCPLNCRWCHNPESRSSRREFVFRSGRCIGCGRCAEVCPEQAIFMVDGVPDKLDDRCISCNTCVEHCCSEAWDVFGEEMTVSQVMKEVIKDRPFYEESGGGITISGGEPMYQPDFLEAILKTCKHEEIHTALDTSGVASWDLFKRIFPHVDLFLYDLKLFDDDRHKRETGMSNRLILDNLRKLSASEKRLIISFVIIPGVNDDDENIAEIGSFLVSLPDVPEVRLLPYHEIGVEKYRLLNLENTMSNTKPPTNERIWEIKGNMEKFGLKITTGVETKNE